MASLASGRLARRLAVVTEAARRTAARRQWVREYAAALASIRAALAAVHIDPARVEAVRRLASSERELAQLGDSPELRLADAAILGDDPSHVGHETFATRAAARAAAFARGPCPTDDASPLDWYAWSLARSTAAARDGSHDGLSAAESANGL